MKEAKGPGTIVGLRAVPGRSGVHRVPAQAALADGLLVSALRRQGERDDLDERWDGSIALWQRIGTVALCAINRPLRALLQ
jgi:hypothetical protein